ncbi:MAG: LytTR family transcriptional regulator DNA-binding domain-containing protein [Acidobacteriota bacterium]
MPFLNLASPLASWWNASIPFDLSRRGGLRLGILAAVAVFAFLALYQPFGTYEAQLENKLWILAGYGVVSGVVVFSVHRIMARWRRLGETREGGRGESSREKLDDRWTRGRYLGFLVTVLLVAALSNYAYSCWALDRPFQLAGLRHFLGLTLLVGIIPVTLLTLLRRAVPLQTTPVRLEAGREGAAEAQASVRELLLEGENRSERLRLRQEDFLFAQAAENYCELVFWRQGMLRRRLLRLPLRRLEEQLEEWEVVRCHRSYLVNLSRVERSSGPASARKLWFSGVEEPVPVARRRAEEIQQRLGELV